jgi:type IV pilus assembly protein PilO
MINLPLDLKNFDFKNIDLKDRKTQQVLIVIAVSVLGAALYIYFVFVPQIMRVTSLIGRLGKMKTELSSAKSTITGMDELKKKMKEYNEKVELYEKKLPEEQEIPSLLENLSGMAKDANITITSIMPSLQSSKADGAHKQGNIYKEIPIVITAKSGYHELGYFLSKLENADRFMKVVDIGIKANKALPKKHDIELMVCTYVLLPER